VNFASILEASVPLGDLEWHLVVLAIAASLDYFIGDPWGLPHPVQAIGAAIARSVRLILARWNCNRTRRLAGIVLAIAIVLGSGAIAWGIVTIAYRISVPLGIALESILLASCFAARSLRMAAEDVIEPLMANDTIAARERLRHYVGRDTQNLSKSEILRAVLETVSENATDGMMAPLFYAIVGAFLPTGSVPIAIAYKAVSTLDSTVGYREQPYTDLGWFSARSDDLLTWLPCRLTVASVGVIGGKPRYVWQRCRQDAIADSSPNASWSECAYAIVLNVRLGGTNWYRGTAKHKPLLGDPIEAISPLKIRQALQLTRYCVLSWLGITIALGIIVARLSV
jgi:adenosylcobinamide-phosphate synthase